MKKNPSFESNVYSKEQLHLGHLNHMDGVSYDIGHPILQLRVVASSCFFGEPKYYEDRATTKLIHSAKDVSSVLGKSLGDSLLTLPAEAQTPAQAVEQVIDEALSFSVEATLQEAVRLRQEEGMRTTPQVILVRAANHPNSKGTGLITKYAPAIISRLDEPAVGLQYQLSQFGKPIPNSLKKAWAKKLESASEFALSKYRLENKEIKLVDVVNLVHAKSEAINKLMRRELKLDGKTWESYISENGSNTESWTHVASIMGHTALLRNIRNFVKNNVAPAAYLNALVETAEKQGEMPFRYYSAYQQVKSLEQQIQAEKPAPAVRLESQLEQQLKSKLGSIATASVEEAAVENHQGANTFEKIYAALEQCVQIALNKTPQFEGKVMSLCDNSGSAQSAKTSELGSMRVSSIANLTAVMTGLISQEGFIGVFGDKLKTMPVQKDKNVFEQVQHADDVGKHIGHGTENGVWLFFNKAIKEQEHWDHIFIYSDMQAGHGGLYGVDPEEYRDYLWGGDETLKSRYYNERHIDVAKLVKRYREKVNPNVRVYMVQVAGYKDTLVPEFYKKTYILGGWGSGLLNFAHYMQKIDS